MEYRTSKEFSLIWKMDEKKISRLCRLGRIPGAYKNGKCWYIPNSSDKPQDYKNNTLTEKLPLPIGESDYINLVSRYYYVDKTLLIKELIDKSPKVCLFTRPRRFGKSLNMNMIKAYFEKNNNDNSIYFKDKKIWECGIKYQQELGKYPVFSISFKDVKLDNFKDSFLMIRDLIAYEAQNFSFLLESEKCNQFEKKYLEKLLNQEVSQLELQKSLLMISSMLKKHFNEQVILLIDEYDTPIHCGYLNNFYLDIISFMRNLLSGAFKDNSNLRFGVLTGVLQIAKESIFSGLNNLTVFSIFEDNFSEYFGFTKEDVLNILNYYGYSEKYSEVEKWYNGYRFGNTGIFNPWSVINYIFNDCSFKPYWLATGENTIIRQIVTESSCETKEGLLKLLQKESVKTYIDNSVIYPKITTDSKAIYNFLLAAGYLRVLDYEAESMLATISIPNKEIKFVYEQEILSSFNEIDLVSTAVKIQDAILNEDFKKFEELITQYLMTTISYFDSKFESFYHGLLIGICAILNNMYYVHSNIENGLGRCDIRLVPHNKKLSGIIIEVKILRKDDEKNIEQKLELLAVEALKQINEKKYTVIFEEEKISRVFKLGVAFYNKQISVITEVEENK